MTQMSPVNDDLLNDPVFADPQADKRVNGWRIFIIVMLCLGIGSTLLSLFALMKQMNVSVLVRTLLLTPLMIATLIHLVRKNLTGWVLGVIYIIVNLFTMAASLYSMLASPENIWGKAAETNPTVFSIIRIFMIVTIIAFAVLYVIPLSVFTSQRGKAYFGVTKNAFNYAIIIGVILGIADAVSMILWPVAR